MGGRGYQFILLRHNTRAMKTAMQELIEKLKSKGGGMEIYLNANTQIINESLEKEKEQIIKAWEDGDYAYFYSKETGRDFDNGEEYYKDVYSTKEVNDDKYSIFDCHGMLLPDHYSGRHRTYEEAKKLLDRLNKNGENRPYTMEKVSIL
jgi:2,3-bisphosphoglycerate-independent phosphoglycerate mutase